MPALCLVQQVPQVGETLADVTLLLEQLEGARDLPAPAYMSQHASGMDLCAAVEGPVSLAPGQYARIPTGIRIAVPVGYEAQVRPRSGLAANHGVTILNAPGTIDADYRGEVCVVLINLGGEPFAIGRGDRIAQLVVAPVTRVRVQLTEELDGTSRGAGGFGHTGR
jgi:dUTP pyrophosphatase